MKTEVVFSKLNKELVIAYTNSKGQQVFVPIVQAEIAPRMGDVVITDSSYSIEKILKECFESNIYKKEIIEIGVKIKHVWKPFMVGDMGRELDFDVYELCRAKRNLSVLIQKFQEVLLYVEPAINCLDTYSHKLRELLILACTEFECALKNYNLGNNERTIDYVKILELTNLRKYKIELAGYSEKFISRPFEKWDVTGPTKTLAWYDAYTQIKHNGLNAFNLATLRNCIEAVAANIIMFSIRYSPHCLYNESDVCSSLIRNTFALQIENTDEKDWYIPIIEGDKSYFGAFSQSISFPNGKRLDNIFNIKNILPLSEQ